MSSASIVSGSGTPTVVATSNASASACNYSASTCHDSDRIPAAADVDLERGDAWTQKQQQQPVPDSNPDSYDLIHKSDDDGTVVLDSMTLSEMKRRPSLAMVDAPGSER